MLSLNRKDRQGLIWYLCLRSGIKNNKQTDVAVLEDGPRQFGLTAWFAMETLKYNTAVG